MGGPCGRGRDDLLPALGLPALPPVRGPRPGAAGRLRHAPLPAHRARLLGGADGRGDRAAAPLRLHGRWRADVLRLRPGLPRHGRGRTGLGQAWTLCVEVAFYVFLPLWVLLIGRHRGALWPLAVLYVASVAYQVVVLGPASDRVAPLDNALIALPGFLDQFALGMGLAVLSLRWEQRGRIPAAARAGGAWWLAAALLFVAVALALWHAPAGLLHAYAVARPPRALRAVRAGRDGPRRGPLGLAGAAAGHRAAAPPGGDLLRDLPLPPARARAAVALGARPPRGRRAPLPAVDDLRVRGLGRSGRAQLAAGGAAG